MRNLRNEVKRIVKEEVKFINEKRSVWRSAEHEEIQSAIWEIKDKLYVFPDGDARKIKKYLDDLERINELYGIK